MIEMLTVRFGSDEYWEIIREIENLKKAYGDAIVVKIYHGRSTVNIIIEIRDEERVNKRDIERLRKILT